ncbi:DUF1690-domain-containing protein [Xylariaceae sp. FL0804]|nr:DUF1690-domain-containing protein [Xylariaceae sp. FL0804]
MGSSTSKPASEQSPYLYKAPGPVRVSQDIVDSLQSSTETDATRAQNLELAVQKRVADELRRLGQQASADLSAARAQASEEQQQQNSTKTREQGGREEKKDAVSAEVEALRARLEGRRQLRAVPESVDRARGDVARCLVENDRRPLDCWREVERFKEEVRRLEKGWVAKVAQ